jgi:hypothetical protein
VRFVVNVICEDFVWFILIKMAVLWL